MRTFVSYGSLIPLSRPAAWNEDHLSEVTLNWRFLTGANEALAKCSKADAAGSAAGFLHNMIWVEKLENPSSYQGVKFIEPPLSTCRDQGIYKEIYKTFFKDGQCEEVVLPFKTWK